MRFMVKFDVLAGAPSKADVEECRALAHRIVSINSWFTIPMLIAGIYAGIAVYDMPDIHILSERAGHMAAPIIRILFGLAVFQGVLLNFSYWKNHWRGIETSCSPIDPFLIDEAIKLAESCEEIEAYRKSVVTTRAMTNGDFEAMRCFATARDETNRKAAQERAVRESFDRLNRLS